MPDDGRWARFLDARVAGLADLPPAIRTLNLPGIDGWEVGRVWSSWPVDPAYFHAGGALFGGWLSALADTYLSLAAMTVLADDEWFATADLRMSYLRPVTSGALAIEATVIYRGARLAQVEAAFTRDDGKLAAKAGASLVFMPFPEAAGDYFG